MRADIDGTIYPNDYAESGIRAWLNVEFIHTAFSNAQINGYIVRTDVDNGYIVRTDVDNGERSTNPAGTAEPWNNGENEFACPDTQDPVFLLSHQEVTEGAYGFDDGPRQKQPTEYAQSQGAYVSLIEGFEGNAKWWLRSPFYAYYGNVYYVSSNGIVSGNVAHDSSCGVVPALQIVVE